jgi:SNF2 family DNA or RNA helicase
VEIQTGQRVRHKTDRSLGQGKVEVIRTTAGVSSYFVSWPSRPGSLPAHTIEELEPIASLADRLTPAKVGPASFAPFVLRVLGRWFEARHALTGELSNQPFQMLPHQVVVTNRVVNSAPDNRRWLIADDVGLGKTIEAGMIMEVLRNRSLRRFRCLIVTPAGLKIQWQEEMELRFRRRFRIFDGKVINDLVDAELLIASIDTLKLERFRLALETVTPWDLVIFDEAHHLATETRVLRHVAARIIGDRKLARNLLFLTATPHSGNTDHFWNMLKLLREDLFPTKEDVTRGDGLLNQMMIRNRKSAVTDTHGERIFKGIAPPKILQCIPTGEEVAFYEALLEYVRKGYGVAERLKTQSKGKANAIGFLMSTFQKLASSSRAAIQKALQNRLRYLQEDEVPAQAGTAETDGDERFAGEQEEARAAKVDLRGTAGNNKQRRGQSPIEDEIANVKQLLGRLSRLKQPDTKLSFFLDQIKALPKDLKLLIFTEYRGTQAALIETLGGQFGADAVTSIHGSMNLAERRQHVDEFNEKSSNPRFMVSTEAGGEGLNMQKSCHTVFNYDLPWNPIRLQQRIGRVYRYGQKKQVQVFTVLSATLL